MFRNNAQNVYANIPSVWYEQVTVARPMVPERDRDAVERRVFPTEVSSFLGIFGSSGQCMLDALRGDVSSVLLRVLAMGHWVCVVKEMTTRTPNPLSLCQCDFS